MKLLKFSRRMPATGVSLLAAALLAGCGARTEQTGLVVEVRAVGLAAGVDLDQLVITAGSVAPASFTLAAGPSASAFTFPFRFGVVPHSSSDEVMDIVVVGRLKGADKVRTSSKVGFIKNEKRLLILTLFAACTDKTPACAAGTRCVADGLNTTVATCLSNKDDVTRLPPFDPSGDDGGAGGAGGSGGNGQNGSGGNSSGGNGSGSSGGTDGGGLPDGPPGACTNGMLRCAPNGQAVESCDGSGSWLKKMDCPNACRAGSCVGSCVPGSKRCGANQVPDRCSDAGEWEAQTACPSVCSGAGICSGKCTPGQMDCQGSKGGTPLVCDGSGNWMAKQPCPSVCTAGACTGMCVPGAHDCSGLQSRLCDDSGNWQIQTTCRYACRGMGSCTTCDPGVTKACNAAATNLQICKSDGSGFQDDTACPSGCNTTRLACNACKATDLKCDQGASSTCKADGSGYMPTSTCDKQCGWAVCPSSGGPCYEMKDTYVIPDVRKTPGYSFCEVHSVALAYTPPLTGPCDYPGGGPVFVYSRSGDNFYTPADTKYYRCLGQLTTQWREYDYIDNPP
ncbi:MAG TPA: hypothetical protein VNO55_15810 [Polyangia bacterium]|nr:hypothetical protein [Polyangia bacterium]